MNTHLSPISVVIVARNEEGNLPRCLFSVIGWVSEVIVALNNTTDRSASIAQAAEARVEFLPWKGFRDSKNEAMQFAKQPWILCLDADEEVSLELKTSIQNFIKSTEANTFSAARFPRKVWFIDRWISHGDWYPDLSLRLLRKGKATWGGDAIVHEKIVCDGTIKTLKGDLYHYSFPTLSSHVTKIVPFADFYVQQQKANGKRFSILAALTRGPWRFFRAYIIRLGFLDGYPGLYIAIANAFGVFVRQSRLFEEQHKTEPKLKHPNK